MISEELIRIQTAKANIKAAIEAKGVSVPASATIDTYAALILEIPTSGSPTPPTPTGSTRTIEVTGILTPSAPTEASPGTYVYVNDGVIYAQLSIAWDGNENEFVTSMKVAGGGGEPAPDFTLNYSGGAFTLVGPWEDNIEFYFNYDAYEECREIPSEDQSVYETFSGDTMTVAFPSLAPMLPCQCEKEGGEWDWDHEVCVYPSVRTLEITDIPTPPSPFDGEDPWTKINIDDGGNYAEFGIVYDWSNYQYVISTSIIDNNSDPVTGFTTAFTNSALTIDGPWGDEVNISYEFNDSFEFGNCLHVGDESATTTEYFDDGETAVSSITLTFPSLEVDAECQCRKEGGEWDYDNEICLHDATLVIDVSSIPNDGNVHEYKVVNGDGDVISVFSIDTSDWSYTNTDDPDSAGFNIHTYGVYDPDDGDDFSQGWFRWILQGKFYGSYEVLVDNTSILADPLDYDGSPMVEHILYDGSDASVTEYGSFEEWDCVENNPDCTWNPNTGECDCL